MRRIAPILLLASGCFYTDPIEQRPSITITQTSSANVYRGDQVTLQAGADDPQNQPVYFQWRVYLCTDATQPETSCDRSPHYTGLQPTETFVVPSVRDDTTTPTQSILVDLAGTDALGATARPLQQLIITIVDYPPDVTLRAVSRHSYVVDTPIDLYAAVGDADDGPAAVLPLAWVVFSPPSQPAYTLDDLTVPQDPTDPAHLQSGMVFTPMGIGDWEIQVTATDPLGVQSPPAVLPITVAADHPPCLEQWSPIAPMQVGQTLPITDPTLFQILVVDDDLDVFPPQPSDPVLGVTTFAWSILPPGATTRVPLASDTGNTASIDPTTYTPGDVVELRVEIQDRNDTPVNCPDSDLTCSVISDPSCIQRLTWQVEIR